MRRLLQWVGVGAAVLVVLLGLAVWNPVAASRVLWPVVENVMLGEPFLGVTADGETEPDLFHIRATGVSTEPIREAAVTFLASLTPEQRGRTLFPVDDLEWRRWANISISTRQGVGLLEMDAAQTAAAFGLLAATLSARGFETSRSIMRLEGHLADLMDDHNEYGERRYWFTVMGEPLASGPWGWQLDGHHLIVNCFVLGDQVVLTPTFMGSEPPRADTGRFAGTAILEEELAAGLALINALDDEQRAVAIIDPHKTANNNRGELFQDNAVVPYEGLRLGELDDAQRETALELVGLYTSNTAARARRGPSLGGGAPLGRHVLRLGRRHESGRGLLLPHPLAGDPDRVRPPDAGGAGGPRPAEPQPRAHGGADAQRQRLRQGPAQAAPDRAPALSGRDCRSSVAPFISSSGPSVSRRGASRDGRRHRFVAGQPSPGPCLRRPPPLTVTAPAFPREPRSRGPLRPAGATGH